MASASKNLSEYNENNVPGGEAFSIGIIVSDWNANVTHAMYDGCLDTLLKHGVQQINIVMLQVPGSFELVAGTKMLLSARKLDAVICLGCVIKGETKHDEYISHAVATGLANLNIASNTPIIFGVLTPNDMEQAMERAGGKHGNKGVEAAVTALRMAELKKILAKTGSKIGY